MLANVFSTDGQSAQVWVLLIFVLTLIGLFKFQHVPERIFGAACLACLGLDFVTTKQLLANTVNPGLVTLMLLVVCAFALEQTSYLRRLSQFLLNKASPFTYIKTLFTTLIASAFLNNTAVVATLINPIKTNKVIAPNKLLLPLSYAAILGGTLTLIGTSTNLIVNSLLIEKGEPGFGFFDFFLIGICTSVVCLALVIIRAGSLKGEITKDKEHAGYFLEAKVSPESELIGQTVEQNGLRNLEQLFLVEVIRNGRLITPVSPSDIILANDKLIFSGDVEKVTVLQQFDGLTTFAEQDGELRENLTEVVVKPGSAIVGRTLKSSAFRSRFDAAVVAVKREGGRLSGKLGNIVIQSGDFLVLAVGPDFSKRTNISKNFFILSGKKVENALSGWREKLTLWGFIGAIALAVLTSISLLKAFLFYMALLVATQCLEINEIKRRFPLELWAVVVGALTLATSFDNVGISEVIANTVAVNAAEAGVYFGFILVFVVTLILTELITNNAAAALMFPIAYSLAKGFGVDILPFVLAVAYGASGSFMSPYGYQTNLMVFNAGNYSFKDVIKFGWPVSLTYSVMVLTLIPMVFPF
ncbi:SLC13 family permease [Psychrosphaera ytuae]|uniref:SLC13 family permease n=2 Tax=Psychrosphaera ytuae TaxID=2820710 RepID=A0A975DF45_9GAMM|nr:SLC13 family permease [Psychrosphaera ytuae]